MIPSDGRDTSLSSLDDKKLLALSRYWGRVGLTAMRRFLATLPEIQRRELFRRCGCTSIYEYAAKYSGATREVVSDVIAVHARIGNHEVLWSLLAEGKVGLTSLRRIARHVSTDTAAWWAHVAQTCTIREIEAILKAKEARSTQEPVRAERSAVATRIGTLSRPEGGFAASKAVAPRPAAPDAPPEPEPEPMPVSKAGPKDQLGSNPSFASVALTPLAAQILENLKLDYRRRGQTLSRPQLLELALKSLALGGPLPEPDNAGRSDPKPGGSKAKPRRVRLPRVLVEIADVGITFIRTVGGLIPLSPAEVRTLDSGRPPMSYTEILANAALTGLRTTGRTPPAIVKLAIAIRAGGRCEVGSCDRLLEEFDHLDPYSEQPIHDPARMVGLCKTCHQAKHNGLIRNPQDPPKDWEIIGVREARRLTRVDRLVVKQRIRARYALLRPVTDRAAS